MHRSKLGLLAATFLVAGVAGCSLPEVLPLAGGTHQGPSPYGPWYEQHWATNAVLLAAADQPDENISPDQLDEEEAALDALLREETVVTEEPVVSQETVVTDLPAEVGVVDTSVKARINSPEEGVEFDNSTPYQFPASEFAPPPAPAPKKVVAPTRTAPPEVYLTPPSRTDSGRAAVPDNDAPIRY